VKRQKIDEAQENVQLNVLRMSD